MTRSVSAQALLEALDAVGLRAGRVGLPDLWPAVAAWWRMSVSDIATADDHRTFLLSAVPRGVDFEAESVFAGWPPEAILGEDLICLDFVREFRVQIAPRKSSRLDGGAAISFWYAAGPERTALQAREDWIDMGISTPHLDASVDGSNVDLLIAYVESTVLEITERGRALAVTVYTGPRPSLEIIAAVDP